MTPPLLERRRPSAHVVTGLDGACALAVISPDWSTEPKGSDGLFGSQGGAG